MGGIIELWQVQSLFPCPAVDTQTAAGNTTAPLDAIQLMGHGDPVSVVVVGAGPFRHRRHPGGSQLNPGAQAGAAAGVVWERGSAGLKENWEGARVDLVALV
jgi:hypothetical protein